MLGFVLGQPASGQDADRTLPATHAGPPTLVGNADLLQLLDGSVLHGQLDSIDPARGLGWRHPDSRRPIEIKPANLDRILFGGTRAVHVATNVTCELYFRNGDATSGSLTALDAGALRFDAWFAPGLNVPRTALQRIAFQPSLVTYEGPTGPEGWQTGPGLQTWPYRNGAFVAQGNCVVGRDFALADSSSLAFDLTWNGSFMLFVLFYSETFDRPDYSRSAYVFQITAGSVNLQRVQNAGGSLTVSALGQPVAVPQMNRKNNVRLELRADKADATLAILADGQPVNRWKDERGFVARGSGVVFYTQINGPLLAIGNIRVSQRHGTGPAGGNAEAAKPGEDVIRLINRDEVSGKLGELRDGKFEFATGRTKLSIPFARVTEILFGLAATNAAAAGPWDVQAGLSGEGAVTFALEKWDARHVAGRSPVFGPIEFDSRAVRELVFNPSGPRVADRAFARDDNWDLDENPSAGRASKPEAPAQSSNTGLETTNAPSAPPGGAQLSLRNGDRVRGALRSIDAAGVIRWQRPDVTEVMEWNPGGIAAIDFAVSPPARESAARGSRVQLVTGDQLQGNVASVDADRIVLETDFAGVLNLPRAWVDTLYPPSVKRAVVFTGPDGPEGWTRGKITAVPDSGEWQYRNGGFYATRAASIARDVRLPDVASIQFDLAWKGALQEAVALYTGYLQPVNLGNKDNEPDFGGFYSLRLGNAGAEMYSVQKSVPVKNFEPAPVPALGTKNSARFEVRINKPQRLMALLVDGALVKQWTDTEFTGSGTGMRFVHQGIGAVRLRNFVVAEWDGQFEEAPSERVSRAQDIVKLRNGDKAVGGLETFRDGKITLSSRGAKRDFPLEQVKQIELAMRQPGRAPDDTANVHAFFRDQQSLKFRLERWNDDGVVGTNSILGRFNLDAAAFERMEFLQGSAKTNRPSGSDTGK